MAKKPERIAAQVFLRTTSGRSLRSLDQAQLPKDLAPFLPSEMTRREAVRALRKLGFEAHMDEMGMTVSIEGPPSLYARVFGVPPDRVRVPAATETVRFSPPATLEALVEEVVLLPKPELFG